MKREERQLERREGKESKREREREGEREGRKREREREREWPVALLITSAKKAKRSLAIAWLDIANAYGSVHHSLIQFSLAHYHAPPEFCGLIQSWYSDLSTTISTEKWSTPPIPLKKGVYQGDPLSVVIFLTVMNTLSDSLRMRPDLGFPLPKSSISLNHLLYADDLCIISRSPAGCRHLLSQVQRWLDWARLKIKVPKSCSMALQASTGKMMDPTLSINNETIPHMGDDKLTFLGMPVRVYKNEKEERELLKTKLESMLAKVDNSLVTSQQKLRLYRYGVCPRLSWSLLVNRFSITWLEHTLQPIATRHLKKWCGIAKSANTSIMFLPSKHSGLSLPSLVGIYKKQQAIRMAQLFSSSDAGVRVAAKLSLEAEQASQRLSFRPAVMADDIRSAYGNANRKQLSTAAKLLLAEEEATTLLQRLSSLPTQGEMTRQWKENSPAIWVKALQMLSSEAMKFSMNASLDTLPTNSNLQRWGKKSYNTCTLCKSTKQTLAHVLNNCPVAMDLRRYSRRHDQVLTTFGEFISAHLRPSFFITTDLPSSTYNFPHHITPTTLRPDIVWWSDVEKQLWLFELTISYETVVADAAQRKKSKYKELIESAMKAGYRSELITVEVGSRGMLSETDLDSLRTALNVHRKAITNLCLSAITTTIRESFLIWCTRNATN